ncbi:MAG: QueT transporter family protein [Candidatus Binataceae bacterium]
MHELRAMWRNTRMVVLCAISGALYAAVLIPFKVVPLIPGVTELRPANAIPVVCSFLFGPAAAWGAAIGNMIGDFFGGFGPGDISGFAANLVYGFIPYKVWGVIARGQSPVSRTPLIIAKFVLVCFLASALCGVIVGWWINLLVLGAPFWVLANAIVFNNMLAAMLLAPFILAAVYPRVQKGHLTYQDLMPEIERPPSALRFVGLGLLIVGTVNAWVAGNLLTTGYWVPGFLPASLVAPPYDKSLGIIVTPMIAVAIIGLMLL